MTHEKDEGRPAAPLPAPSAGQQAAFSDTRQPDQSPPAKGGESPERILRSVDLMAGAREVRIEHSGEFYRLRVTRQGKLILYK